MDHKNVLKQIQRFRKFEKVKVSIVRKKRSRGGGEGRKEVKSPKIPLLWLPLVKGTVEFLTKKMMARTPVALLC